MFITSTQYVEKCYTILDQFIACHSKFKKNFKTLKKIFINV